MKNFIWFLAILFLLIVQLGVLLPLRLVPVNLILVIVVVAVLLSEFNHGLFLTILGGLCLDFLSGAPFGLITSSMLSTFLILYFVVNSVLSREPSQTILLTAIFASTVIFFIFFLTFNQLLSLFHISANLSFKYILTSQLPLTIFFNLLLSYPVFRYYLWIQKITHSRLTA